MSDVRKELRRKAWWSVADFASFTGMSHWQAKRRLQSANEAMHGMLLRPSKGTNRKDTFLWRPFAKQFPEYFVEDPIELAARVDRIEDDVDDLKRVQRFHVAQTGQNTRDIAKLRRASRRAA